MKKLSRSILIILGLLLTFSCNQPSENHNDEPLTIEPKKSKEDSEWSTASQNIQWANRINQKSDSVQLLYTKEAVKVFSDGSVITGSEAIKDHWLKQSLMVDSIQSKTVLLANSDRKIYYEIGEFWEASGDRFKQLIIWETVADDLRRCFELIEKVETPTSNLVEVDNRRVLWGELCQEGPEKLINELYTKNTIYYNHKPLIIGQSDLIKEYQYMNREGYKVFLRLNIIQPVNDRLAFEIGQCDGSYHGKYILVWEKGVDDEWRILVDSNI